MMNFLKKLFRKSRGDSREVLVTDREKLKTEIREGSREAVKRYKGVLERLAEYDRT